MTPNKDLEATRYRWLLDHWAHLATRLMPFDSRLVQSVDLLDAPFQKIDAESLDAAIAVAMEANP